MFFLSNILLLKLVFKSLYFSHYSVTAVMSFILASIRLDIGNQPHFEPSSDLQSCHLGSGPKLALRQSIDWQKILHFFRNALKCRNCFYYLTKQRQTLSGISIKFRAMEPNNMTICYWMFFETSSQMKKLNMMSNFCLFPEMLRKTKKFYIDCIK